MHFKSMKTSKSMMALMVAVLGLFAACHKPDEPKEPVAEKPNWVAATNPQFSSSMTIICVPPVGETASESDELAAFLDGTCYRVATLNGGIFYLGVPGPESEQPMELRYYSASKQNIRTLNMTYIPGARLGSSDVPYQLAFDAAAVLQRIVLHGAIAEDAAAAPRRVNIGVDEGTQLSLFWREGDMIRVQSSTGGNATVLTISNGVDTHTADFEGFGTGIANKVSYPASATFSDGYVTFSIPATQQYEIDNYANNLMPMQGEVTNAESGLFDIVPIGAVLCLQLTGTKTVKSIALTVPNDVHDQLPVSGNFQTDGNEVTGDDDTKGYTITLDCGTGVLLKSDEATKFHFVLPAVYLLSGTAFQVNFTDNTHAVTKETKKDIRLGQGRYTTLPAFSVN